MSPPPPETVADQPWYRVVIGGLASWVGSSTFQATGLLSSGVLAAAIVVFYAWRRIGARPVTEHRRRPTTAAPVS